MDKIRKSFRARKKDKSDKSDKIVLESNKPHQWQEDERKVREGNCSFQVKVKDWRCALPVILVVYRLCNG